jgi:hypothetical protein
MGALFLLGVGFEVFGRGSVHSDLRPLVAIFGWFLTSLMVWEA